MNISYLPKIRVDRVPNILLLGNGFNRAFHADSWDDLLEDTTFVVLNQRQKHSIRKVPYPMRPIILTDDQVDESVYEIAGRLAEMPVPKEEKALLQELFALPVDAVLTTNYTYELEKTIWDHFTWKAGCNNKYRHFSKEENNRYQRNWLHLYYQDRSKKIPPIFHIHGEAGIPKTMVYGHYYYGLLLSEICQYATGRMGVYRTFGKKIRQFYTQSWIDYFLLGNVYILGQGMSLSEMDIWWLINFKKRHGRKNGQIYLFQPNISVEQEMMADSYDVKCFTEKVKEEEYAEYYRRKIPQIQKMIQLQENTISVNGKKNMQERKNVQKKE